VPSTAETSRSAPRGPIDHENVSDFHDARLQRLDIVAGPSTQRDDRHISGPDDVDFVLPGPTVSTMTMSKPAASEYQRGVPLDQAKPPRCPRVAMLRTRRGVAACCCMRDAIASTAPPVKGLSTARKPDGKIFARSSVSRRSTSVFPGARRTGHADEIRRPV
jgi:hypothetical protein